MGYVFFYFAVVAACLLWSAAFTAVAARTRPGWIRRLLVAVAVIVPPLAVAPWAWVTGWLAALGFETNWFAPTLTAMIAAAIGGVWIAVAGLAPRAAPAAATWPLVGLAAMFVVAKAVAAGTLLFIDNAVRAEARAARAEAVAVMQSIVPPPVPVDDNAVPLYRQVFERLAADDQLAGEESPLADVAAADLSAPSVTNLLARQAATLELLRRAADRPGCRFPRDWSRPRIDMLLPEIQSMRQAARLLALAARREAAVGEGAAALADVVRLHRMARHVAAEPIVISGLVGNAIDGIALETLAAVLPRITPRDAATLDEPALGDFVRGSISFDRQFLGEEAFGLAQFALLADGPAPREIAGGEEGWPTFVSASNPLAVLFRCFLLPGDLAAYRRLMKEFQALAEQAAQPGVDAMAIHRRAEAIEQDLVETQPGIFTRLIAPTLGRVLDVQLRSRAAHRAAEVLLAASRARLATGELPATADSLMPEWLLAVPADPFREQGSLTVKAGDEAWLVYSVGPDGEDDGGPPPDGAEPAEGNDDVGLRLAVRPAPR